MAKRRTHAEIDADIERERNKTARYMLVNADTGEDMREAQEFEVKVIQHNGGQATFRLGGGWKNPEKNYRVKLRMLGVHQPGRAQMRNPTLPKETFAAVDRHGNIIATSSTYTGAMHRAGEMMKTGSLRIKGEYTSDGHHWGLGKGRTVAQRESTGGWRVG